MSIQVLFRIQRKKRVSAKFTISFLLLLAAFVLLTYRSEAQVSSCPTAKMNGPAPEPSQQNPSSSQSASPTPASSDKNYRPSTRNSSRSPAFSIRRAPRLQNARTRNDIVTLTGFAPYRGRSTSGTPYQVACPPSAVERCGMRPNSRSYPAV